MAKDSRYIQIAFSIQNMLESDGKLDETELDQLLTMALKDHEIDDDERRILRLVFRQLAEKDVTPAAWVKLQDVRKKFAL